MVRGSVLTPSSHVAGAPHLKDDVGDGGDTIDNQVVKVFVLVEIGAHTLRKNQPQLRAEAMANLRTKACPSPQRELSFRVSF